MSSRSSDRLRQTRLARDAQIQQQIDDPRTSTHRRAQLIQLQRRRQREGRSAASEANTNNTTQDTISDANAPERNSDAPSSLHHRALHRRAGYNDLRNIIETILSVSRDGDIEISVPGTRVQNQTPTTDFRSQYEEDSDDYTDLSVDVDTLSDEYISDNTDETCATGSATKDRTWLMKNCSVCKSMVTLDDFSDEDVKDIVSIKIYDRNSSKFGKGQCILRDDIRGMLQSDIGSERPKYVYAIYQTKDRSILYSEGELQRGIGTAPSKYFVVQLNIGQTVIFVTLGSVHKLLRTERENVLYAAPLYGGKRRRIGNVEGNLFLVGANHGQIPGFQVYKLFTREEIERGVEVDHGESDFIFPMTICRNMEAMLNIFNDTTAIRRHVVDDILKYILRRDGALKEFGK